MVVEYERRVIFIKLDNLKVGMVLKNYKELCNALDIKPLIGYSRQKQLLWFEEYFLYKKEGHKYVITEIFNKEVVPMQDNRGGAYNTIEYKENIEKLVLDILAQAKNKGQIFLSKNKFFYALEMVNINYLDTKQRIPKLSKYLDIDEYTIQEWMDTTGGVLERSLESALTSLRNKALVIWSKEITIHKLEEIESSEVLIPIVNKDKYGEEKTRYITQKRTLPVTREATDEEKKFILKTEKETLNKLGCVDKREIIQKGLWKEFDSNVKKVLQEKRRILYYYQSYKILSNPEHIQAEFRKKYLLDNDTKAEEKISINSSVLDRLENNALSRYTNAIKQLEENDIILYQNEKIVNRSDDNYMNKNVKLNKVLIDRNAPDIRSEIRKTKLNE